ncbi:hypothetical protein [Bdellovibrio svalbardensis]|uniref:Uncharacterized protein n=1 Tax=Bdellovibrio svalbardensis TaxID=2972972 RepID=A0ABT6DL71_9BACT|nr:hypothetical protein [Bdellovibrio svalbardensis]MDG0817329.1 hypothetical protein [Bdellovibrio svalbardensis]
MKDIKKDFESFTDESGSSANTSAGSSFVLQKIQNEIAKTAPKRTSVAAKLGAVHLVSSVITLTACPQFGLRLFFQGEGMMHYFMKISPTFCQSFCGALYLSVTFLLARFVLKYDEWLVVLRSRALSIATLALLSLGTFAMINRQMSFETGVFWIFGATLGAEAVSASKQTLRKIFSFSRA